MNNVLKLMQQNLELKGASKNTIDLYMRVIDRFIEFYDKSPEELGNTEVREFLLYFIHNKKCSAKTIQVYHAALKFLYETTINQPWVMDSVPRMKSHRKLPAILDQDEIVTLLKSIDFIKHKALLSIIYSAGLRVSEASNLKVSDIDSKRMQIKVNNSKGAKDRYTILSEVTVNLLREYWKIYKPDDWLFPGRFPDRPMSNRGIANIFNTYKKKAGISKPVTTHSLRHSFATHLLENGTSLVHIQRLLGHGCIESTMLYLHLRRADLQSIVSPLDLIKKKI